MLVDEVVQDFRRRSSSAWAKNALASLRISLALRSSLFSRSSSFRRYSSVVVMPSRTRVDLMTFDPFVEGLGTQPILGAMDSMAPTAMGAPLGAPAPCEQRVRVPRVKTCLPLSLLNPLREMSLFKIRGVQ
jgi:hypothetical protein